MALSYTQYGSGISDIGVLYRNPGIPQRGAGVGSLFGGLWKFLKPLAKTVGKQTIKAGGNIIRDVASGKNMRDALYDQGQQAISDLSEIGINRLKKMQILKKKRKFACILLYLLVFA